MPFNSLKYFLFLPLVYLVFLAVGQRARWMVLLAASFAFYAALGAPYLLAVLAMVTVTNYLFGLWLGRARTTQAKRVLLWCGVAVDVLILVVMKYLPFLSENLNFLAEHLSLPAAVPPARALLAIGVSYFIFQALSYLFDLYLEIEEPEPHLGYFALYLVFFPKLLQGPIERAADLLPQLKQKYRFDYDNMRYGLLLFSWGLFKKVVIADRLGLTVDAVYNNPHAFSGLPLLLASYAYAFQIYMDFSGYTDMALGAARLFNISLTQNFNSPYLATSVADFWRRWHITFSRWILDYIFKPLQMQWRNGKNWGTAAALFVAFLVSGIWHGASWSFVIWGALHGLYLACSVFYKPYQKKLHKVLGIEKTPLLKAWQIVVTFNLVCVAWTFFRAAKPSDALYLFANLFKRARGMDLIFQAIDGKTGIAVLLLSFSIYLLIDAVLKPALQPAANSAAVRWLSYYVIVMLIVLFSVQTTKSNFLYFAF